MNKDFKHTRFGRIFFSWQWARKKHSRWVRYDGRIREDYFFKIGRAYHRDHKLYIWVIVIGRLSLGIGLLKKKVTL